MFLACRFESLALQEDGEVGFTEPCAPPLFSWPPSVNSDVQISWSASTWKYQGYRKSVMLKPIFILYQSNLNSNSNSMACFIFPSSAMALGDKTKPSKSLLQTRHLSWNFSVVCRARSVRACIQRKTFLWFEGSFITYLGMFRESLSISSWRDG